MTLRRYSKTSTLGLGFSYGTSYIIPIIRQNMATGRIRFDEIFLDEGERLDILAGKIYGDSSLFWILAACSDIGWSLQVPPGTRLKIPNLDDLKKFM